MNIVIVSDYERQGGAASSTSRLCEQLAADGHTVHRVVCRPSGASGEPWSVRVLHWRRARGRVSKLWRKLASASARPAGDRRAVVEAFTRCLGEIKPDVVNFRNIHGATSAGWSDDLLAAAARVGPACFTLHDMWWLTGRCAYSHACRKFESGCDASCPTPDEYPAMEPRLIGSAWLARRAMALANPHVGVIPVSHWIGREAQASVWGQHPTRVIHNAIRTETYSVLERDLCRAELGLPSDGLVLAAVAVDWASPHKGGGLLVDCLRQLGARKPTLLLLGGGALPPGAADLRVVQLGFRTEARFKSLVMGAADCMVHPATAENFSNALLEAAACGVPVAAFDIGGNAEIVSHGRTGSLASTLSGAALAAAVQEAEALGGSRREAIRADARERFDLLKQAASYVEFYQQLARPKAR